MRPDALRPLPPSLPLVQLLSSLSTGPRRLVGVWVRGGDRPLRLVPRCIEGSALPPLLVSADLHYLLALCDRVAVRRGGQVRVLRSREAVPAGAGAASID